MARSIEEILKAEEQSLQGHSRKYFVFLAIQLLVMIVSAVSGAVSAFAQSGAAKGTNYASPRVLFWASIISAITAVLVGLGLTANVAKQRSRRDFHRMMVGKLTRKRIKPEEAESTIDEYFGKWRD